MYKIIFTLSLFLLIESCDDNGHEPLQCLEGVEDQDNDGICDDIDNCIWQSDCNDCASNCEGSVSFTNNIQSIFNAYCFECHVTLSQGGLDLSNHTSTLAGGNSGVGVYPGDVNQSEIWRRISTLDNMPPDDSPDLPVNYESLIYQWIEEGAIE